MVNISEDKLSMFLQQFATVSMACMQEIISGRVHVHMKQCCRKLMVHVYHS